MSTGDPHDRLLVDNVRPPGWVNPVPRERYHLVVVGAGAAGLVCAAGAATLGARVALVEQARMGGDCLNAGCVPSKALLRAARAVADVRAARDYGIRAGAPDVDFGAVMTRLRRVRAELSRADSAARFRGLGVDVFFGQGRFTGRDTVRVGDTTLRFTRAVIATGARAALPAIPGLAAAGVLTSDSVFDLDALPRRLAILGAGPLGCELAQAFARFGAQVTVVESMPRVLGREDPDAAEHVKRALEADGVRFVLDAKVGRVVRQGPETRLELAAPASTTEIVADQVLVAAGRAPTVESLDLAKAGVAADPLRGVLVDDRLRTSNARIFAAGDVCSAIRLTHNADAQARIVLRNALFAGRARASALTIPWCTYTDPEVARVGLDEEQARERGIAVQAFVQPLTEVDRAVLDGESDGFVKVLVRRGRDRIVGATVVARHAGEMLGELTVAMTQGIGLGTLAGVVHAYPTQADAIRRLGDAYNRTRLSPLVRRLLAGWLAWRG